jgi:hypothetical protein
LTLMSASAWAQGGGWEVEAHVGGAIVNNLDDGAGTLPPAGTPFTTVAAQPGRLVPSWYFGDGAALLNDVLAGVSLPDRITPMDFVLTGRAGERGNGVHFGVRVARALTPRFGAEFNLDVASAPVTFTSGAEIGLQTSSDSFETALNGLISTGPFANGSTASTVLIEDDDGRQVTVTGALTVNLASAGTVLPYVTLGAGVVSSRGDLPTASVDGSYAFDFLGIAPLAESDSVQVTYDASDNVLVGVFGGGVKAMLNATSGIRADVRVHVGSQTVHSRLDARPAMVPDPNPATWFALATLTSPSLQLSNNPALAPTSLSGAAVTDFETFSADGQFRQVLVSVGYFWRF